MPIAPRKSLGVLFSGGLDSAALVGYLAKQRKTVLPIYVRCGLPWEHDELVAARAFLRRLRFRNVKPLATVYFSLSNAYQGHWSKTGDIPGRRSADTAVFLPARNLLLAVRAALYLSPLDVRQMAFATLKGNPFPDGTRFYFQRLERVLSDSFKKPFRLLTPFRQWDKSRVLKTCRDLPLEASLSCLHPLANVHCGECNKCTERQKAFIKAGIIDRTRYRVPKRPIKTKPH